MAEDNGAGDDVTVEAPLPLVLELPDYHGRKAVGMKTKLTGTGNRISTPHAIGEKFVLVLEVRSKGDGHEETDDGILYVQTAKVLDLFEVQGEPGKRLVSTLRQAHRLVDDARVGKTALGNFEDDLATAGITDGSGVVLTKDELAELRGDPVRSMLDDATTPVVVLYSDGARELWPDDFEAETVRPVAGERFRIDGEEGPLAYVFVEKLLDVSTGETLAEWTEEQENARLLELEQTAETAEASDNAGAGDPIVDEIDRKLEESGEAMREASDSSGDEHGLDDGLEPLGGEPLAPLPGDEGAEIVHFPGPAAELAEEIQEPSEGDFAFVDRNLDEVLAELPMILNLAQARRIAEAERRGRGRNLKTRKGAMDAILGRIAELEKAAE